MNWDSIYHMYEGIVLLVTLTCFGLMSFTVSDDYCSQFDDVYQALEQSNIHSKKLWWNNLTNTLNKKDDGYQLFKKAHELWKNTEELLQQIEEIKYYLKQFTAGNTQAVNKYMIYQRKAYQLEEWLNNYTKTLNTQYQHLDIPYFESLTLGNQKHWYNQDRWRTPKDFAHTYFANASVADALATLTHKQAQVFMFFSWIAKAWQRYHIGYVQDGCAPTLAIGGIMKTGKEVQVGDSIQHEIIMGQKYPFWQKNLWYYAEVNGKRVFPKEGLIYVKFKVSGKGKYYWTGKFSYCHRGVEYTNSVKMPYWVTD